MLIVLHTNNKHPQYSLISCIRGLPNYNESKRQLAHRHGLKIYTRSNTLEDTEKLMANYYTRFSFVLELPDEQALDYAIALMATATTLYWQSDEERQTNPLDFPETLKDSLDDWSFEAVKENSRIWIHSDDGGVESACQFVQHLLKKFRIDEPVTFEWANTCTKPLLDAFGGGAAIITATTIKAFSTCQWILKQQQRMTKRKTSVC